MLLFLPLNAGLTRGRSCHCWFRDPSPSPEGKRELAEHPLREPADVVERWWDPWPLSQAIVQEPEPPLEASRIRESPLALQDLGQERRKPV